MPERRVFHRFACRYLLLNLLSMAPFVAVFAFLWHRISTNRIDAWFWAAAGAFTAGATFGLWWQWHRVTRTTCPQCRRPLVRSNNVPAGTPLNFVCRHCDIEWVTGLFKASD